MLRQRVISATILAFLIGLLVYFLRDDFLTYLVALIASISLLEFLRVRFSNLISIFILIFFLILMAVTQLTFFSYLFISLSVALYLVSAIFILSFPLNKTLLKNTFVWACSGLIIHLGFYASIFQIISQEDLSQFSLSIVNERFLIFYIILISILMDSFAYFAGKSLGKRPFINNVSPNKTMEGFLTAIVATPLLLFFSSQGMFELSVLTTIFLLFAVSIFSVIGDAFASMMKRVIEIKDFSNLIPGHGGLFDRLDSHIAAFPCFIFLTNLF